MARIAPLPVASIPEMEADFAFFERTLGFVPNSLRTMAYRPSLAKGLIALSRGVYDPAGEVDLGFKRLVGHVASMAAGCLYCRAHTATSALRHGIAAEKMAAIADYRSSPLFSDAERTALDFALAAASQPNDVSDELFAKLQMHWSDAQIVEILGVIALFGFFNRWNDSLATTLESEPLQTAGNVLGATGWTAGKHTPTDEDTPA